MRSALIDLLSMFLSAVKSSAVRDPIRELMNASSINSFQRSLVHDFCCLVLKSFVLEAESVGLLSEDEEVRRWRHTGQHMSDPWRDRYHRVKANARELLLSIHDQTAAMQLALSYFDYEGIFLCYHQTIVTDRQLIKDKILDFLDQHAEVRGTQDIPLGLFWLECLESAEYPSAEIFDFGLHCGKQLSIFLASRPQLAWLYDLDHQRYDEAAKNAILHGQRIDDLSQARSVFSIAKLAARVALQDEDHDSSSSKSEAFYLREADRQLALLKAQEAIQELVLVSDERQQQEQGINILPPLSVIDLVLASMQRDIDDVYTLTVTDIDRYARAVTIAISVLTMIDAYEAKETVDTYISRLWSMSLQIQQELWLWRSQEHINTDGCEASGLGLTRDEEQELKESVYAKALSMCLQEGRLLERGDLLPPALNLRFLPSISEGSDSALLDEVVEASSLTNKRIDADLSVIHSEHKNQRLVRLIHFTTAAMAVNHKTNGL
jgi:hypothetical protein